MQITLVAGARPNFMKIAPIIDAIRFYQQSHDLTYRLVHTGQHYNKELSDTFFEQLSIPHPDANLEVGSGTHAYQTAQILIRFEEELLAHPADLVLVVGDVNSTMAATIVAKKLNIPVAHVEAGLRSFDMTMPEEINRLVTDSIADYYFTTTTLAGENLKRIGADADRIFFVGNTMIDSLIKHYHKLEKPAFWEDEGLLTHNYFLLTLHRPSNVDDVNKLTSLLHYICRLARDKMVVFPIHPRTLARLGDLTTLPENLVTVSPLGYLQFIYLMKNCLAVITDSGGVQEETTYLRIPCLTLRENTERPETVSIGTNELIGNDMALLAESVNKVFEGSWKKGRIPELWDGKTGSRIIETILNKINSVSLNRWSEQTTVHI